MRGPARVLALVAAIALSATAALALPGGASGYTIWQVAGTGTPCATPPSCGDGAVATAAQLSYPVGVAVGSAGNAYIADWGDNEVRKVSPTGSIAQLAGGGTPCSAPPACGDGGPASEAQLSFPDGVAVDRSGNVYIADTGDNEIRKVSPNGTITRLAGNGVACSTPPACGDGGPAASAQLATPFGVAVDGSGNVYVADAGDNEIRKITAAGRISRIAGTGTPCSKPPNCGDGGAATSAQLNFPAGLAIDKSGNVYVADDGDNEVRKISTAGTISRVAGTGAACASPPACGDGGAAVSATLGAPDGVAVDQHGNLYIADDLDNEVRKVSAAGTISRIAGTGAACTSVTACGNGGSGLTALLNYPDAVAVDPLGNVFVDDTFDQQLRLLSAASGSSVKAAEASVSVLAFGPSVARGSVTVRYLLSGTAGLTLSLTPPGGRPSVVARATRRAGWGMLKASRPAKHGSYKLTVTATVGGRSAASSVRAGL